MPPKWGAKLRQAALKAREGTGLKSRLASGHAAGQSFRVERAELTDKSNRQLAPVEEGVEANVQGTSSRRSSHDSSGHDARRPQLIKAGTFRSRVAMAMHSHRTGGQSQRGLAAAAQASHISGEGAEGHVQGTSSRRSSQDSAGPGVRRSQLKGGTFRSRETMAMSSQRMGGQSQRGLAAAAQASHISGEGASEGHMPGTSSRRSSQDSAGPDVRRSQLKGGTFRSRETMAMNSQRMGKNSHRSLVAATQASHVSGRSQRSLLGATQVDRTTGEPIDKMALKPKASRRFQRAFTAIKHMRTFRTLSGHLKATDGKNEKEAKEAAEKGQKGVRKLRFLPKTKQELVKVRRRLDESKMKEGGSPSESKATNRLVMEDLAETLTEFVPSVSQTAARKIHTRKLNKV